MTHDSASSPHLQSPVLATSPLVRKEGYKWIHDIISNRERKEKDPDIMISILLLILRALEQTQLTWLCAAWTCVFCLRMGHLPLTPEMYSTSLYLLQHSKQASMMARNPQMLTSGAALEMNLPLNRHQRNGCKVMRELRQTQPVKLFASRANITLKPVTSTQ